MEGLGFGNGEDQGPRLVWKLGWGVENSDSKCAVRVENSVLRLAYNVESSILKFSQLGQIMQMDTSDLLSLSVVAHDYFFSG